jgi:hypothetical protein
VLTASYVELISATLEGKMKKTIVALLITCLLTGFSLAGISDDETKPYVLINTNVTDPGYHAINEFYRQFWKMVKEEGFEVNQAFLTEITDETLEGVDILFLAIPGFSLSEADKEALNRFLQGGGGIVLMGYPNRPIPFDSLISTSKYFMYTDFTNLNSFIRKYGITFGNAAQATLGMVYQMSPLVDPYPCEKILLGPGGIVASVTSAFNANGLLFVLNNFEILKVDEEHAEAFLHAINSDVVAGARSFSEKLGKGRLVVFGTDVLFSNFAYNFIKQKRRAGIYWDNFELGLNLMHYLAGHADLALDRVKVRKKNHTAGEEITCVFNASNAGIIDVSTAEVVFYLTQDSSTTPIKVLTEIGSVDVGPLAAGMKLNPVKTKLTLPTDLEPGSYYVAGEIVYGGDGNEDNNMKWSKEFSVN